MPPGDGRVELPQHRWMVISKSFDLFMFQVGTPRINRPHPLWLLSPRPLEVVTPGFKVMPGAASCTKVTMASLSPHVGKQIETVAQLKSVR